MKNILREINEYKNVKLYNFIEVVDNLKQYYGFSIEELEYLFKEYSILKWEVIYEDLITKGFNIREIEKRKNTYYVYKKSLENLSFKGLELIELLKYLCDFKDVSSYDDIFENMLDEMEIYHWTSILNGDGIRKLLVLIFHLINNFNEYLGKINRLDTYEISLYDDWNLIFGGEKLYPNKNLILYDDEYDKDLLDKTSVLVKRKCKVEMTN